MPCAPLNENRNKTKMQAIRALHGHPSMYLAVRPHFMKIQSNDGGEFNPTGRMATLFGGHARSSSDPRFLNIPGQRTWVGEADFP